MLVSTTNGVPETGNRTWVSEKLRGARNRPREWETISRNEKSFQGTLTTG